MANCLVTGGTKNDTAPMAVLLMNLRDTQSWIDHVVIFHDGISAKDQKLMQSIIPVEFIRYRFPGNRKTFNEIVRYVYTEMVFCKYECFRLLERFNHVVWSDYDVVFLKDIPELVQNDGIGIKALFYNIKDSVGSFSNQLRGEGWKKMADGLDFQTASICTCLFALSKKLSTAGKIYQHCITVTEQYGEYLVLPEQAVLNIVFQQEHIEPEKLSWDYSFNPGYCSVIPPSVKVLHCAGQPKFWNGLYNETWQKNYEKWLEMGGSKWKPEGRFSLRKIKKTFAFYKQRLFH